mmetsp:Transcript_27301/g.49427  ORF Transcript_27301/g.49427 Transcript_27301/m.49427 type:complete len:218 (-) Transcript_27301:74-727(-)
MEGQNEAKQDEIGTAVTERLDQRHETFALSIPAVCHPWQAKQISWREPRATSLVQGVAQGVYGTTPIETGHCGVKVWHSGVHGQKLNDSRRGDVCLPPEISHTSKRHLGIGLRHLCQHRIDQRSYRIVEAKSTRCHQPKDRGSSEKLRDAAPRIPVRDLGLATSFKVCDAMRSTHLKIGGSQGYANAAIVLCTFLFSNLLKGLLDFVLQIRCLTCSN